MSKTAGQGRSIRPDYFSRSGLVAETGSYILRHPLQLLGAAIVPVSLGSLLLYIALDAYLLQLLAILRAPSESAETLLLGIASAAFVLGLFAHSVATAGITATVRAEKPPGYTIRIAITQADVRLFAASLRLLLVMCLVVALGMAFLTFLSAVGIQPDAGYGILRLMLLAVAAVILLRLGMLMPAVAVREHGSVLRRSFMLTRGRTQGVILFALLLLLPGLLAEMAGDYVVRHVVGLSLSAYTTSLMQSSLMLRAVLPYFITVLAISYTAALICLTVGSSLLYRRLTAAGR